MDGTAPQRMRKVFWPWGEVVKHFFLSCAFYFLFFCFFFCWKYNPLQQRTSRDVTSWRRSGSFFLSSTYLETLRPTRKPRSENNLERTRLPWWIIRRTKYISVVLISYEKKRVGLAVVDKRGEHTDTRTTGMSDLSVFDRSVKTSLFWPINIQYGPVAPVV